MDTSDPRQRLLDLARASGVSLSALSRMIGKNAAYLQQFVKRGTPRKLEEDDRARLARFFSASRKANSADHRIFFLKQWPAR
ncbi:hypothetical protein ACFSTD_10710 [Novosphingobium colocasiae]